MKFSLSIILTLSVFCAINTSHADKFSFAILCDSRGNFQAEKCSDDNWGTSPVLKPLIGNLLDQHSKNKINLIVFPGDLISGYYQRDEPSVHDCNRKQLSKWREIFEPISQLEIPIRITAGNHEAMATTRSREKCGSHQYPYTPAYENFEVLEEVLPEMIEGNPGPGCDLGLTYSFDLGPCRFIMLNSYTMVHANAFSEETIQWLVQELEAAQSVGKHIFVASHSPAFPGSKDMWDSLPLYDPTYSCDHYDPRFGIDRRRERDRFWNILKKYNVVAYLCGHEHNIQVQSVEGVWHILSGGLTEKLQLLNGAEGDKHPNTILYDGAFQNPRADVVWPWNESKKSYWGWCLVTVADDGISLEVFGSENLPKKSEDFRSLKTFKLR